MPTLSDEIIKNVPTETETETGGERLTDYYYYFGEYKNVHYDVKWNDFTIPMKQQESTKTLEKHKEYYSASVKCA